MQQYAELLREIKKRGTYKAPAREGMPGTLSLFGYQFRHNLAEGFPLLTTKKLSFKNIVVELLWFLKGDTNIKYLVDNGCNIWNEDAYNYYMKMVGIFYKRDEEPPFDLLVDDPMQNCTREFTFEEFIDNIKAGRIATYDTYKLGDCGKQYGWLWRNWKGQYIFGDGLGKEMNMQGPRYISGQVKIDQLKELIEGLQKNPMSRRHIITAWNPATLDDMALNACHAFVQFNCRPLSDRERVRLYGKVTSGKASRLVGDFKDINDDSTFFLPKEHAEYLDEYKIPRYYLDCQMYQRSADVFLGVPYNIASYALLIEVVANLTGMIPGELIHTFGDVHIYDNHIEQVNEQLSREYRPLPQLLMRDTFHFRSDWVRTDGVQSLDKFIEHLEIDEFKLENYNPHPSIKAKLSTGLK